MAVTTETKIKRKAKKEKSIRGGDRYLENKIKIKQPILQEKKKKNQ